MDGKVLRLQYTVYVAVLYYHIYGTPAAAAICPKDERIWNGGIYHKQVTSDTIFHVTEQRIVMKIERRSHIEF